MINKNQDLQTEKKDKVDEFLGNIDNLKKN